MKKEKSKKSFARICASLFAGVLNGLLGTGGGIPLYFLLAKEGKGRGAYATASVCVLLLSAQTLFLYRGAAVPLTTVSPFLPLFAVIGGCIGALLLGKVNTRLLRLFFGLLLLFSGGYTLGKELYFVFS